VLAVSVGLGAVAGRVGDREIRSAPPRFDWVGSLLLAAALTSIVIGLRPDGGHAVALLAAGAALLVPFVLWEQRAGDPVIAFFVFRSVPFSAGTVLIAVQNLVMYALLFEVPLVAKELFDLGARGTGQLLVSLMLAMVIVSPVGGRLVDRIGARAVALAGSVAALTGIVALARVDLTAGQVVAPLALLGAGLGLATPAAQSASITAAPADHAGMAAGVGSTMRYLGGLIGVAVLSVLLDVSGTRAAVISEHRMLMTVFAGALLVGLVCAAFLPDRLAAAKPRTEDVQSGI
jgi:MFS family permease